MNNTNYLLTHDSYQKLVKDLADQESERIFCKHSLQHFIDVARICYIHCLEDQIPVDKDLVYVTALLHDLGRSLSRTDGKDHHLHSLEIARSFLQEMDFNSEQQAHILQAISQHSHTQEIATDPFVRAFQLADKEARLCFQCPAYDLCYWPEERKNQVLKY